MSRLYTYFMLSMLPLQGNTYSDKKVDSTRYPVTSTHGNMQCNQCVVDWCTLSMTKQAVLGRSGWHYFCFKGSCYTNKCFIQFYVFYRSCQQVLFRKISNSDICVITHNSKIKNIMQWQSVKCESANSPPPLIRHPWTKYANQSIIVW